MKTRRLISAIMILAIGAAVISSASAIETGWYVGGGLGNSDPDKGGFDDNTGFKLFGGRNFNERFAIEVAHVDLGETNRGPVEFEVDGFQFVAVGHLPIGEKFSVFGKGGLYLWDADAEGARDDDGTDLTFGLGLQYDTEKWGIRVEWERFDGTEPGDFDLLSVNGILHFK